MAGRAEEVVENKVVVRAGKVTAWENWGIWNGQVWPTIVVMRTEDGFRSNIGDPEYGNGQTTGKRLEEVIQSLHPQIQEDVYALFALENPTAEAIRRAGFDRFAIVAV